MASIASRQRWRRRATAAAVAGLGVLTVAFVLPWSGAGVGTGTAPAGADAVGVGADMDCGPLFERPVAGAYYFVCRPRPAAGGDGSRAPHSRPGHRASERLWLAATGTRHAAA